ATAAGDYTVTNTNTCGTATSNHIVITINPQPAASTITAGGATAFCSGGSVLLSGNANGGAWNQNGNPVGTGTTFTATTAGDYTVTNTNSCGTATSNHIVVTVNALPTVSFSGLASSYAVNAASAILTGSPAGGTFSGPGISGSTFNPATAGVGGPYVIDYNYTNTSGCVNKSSQLTTVTGSCTVLKKPGAITTVGGTAKVCPGDVKNYTIVAISGATGYTWTAPSGGVITGGQGTTSVTITYNAGFIGDSLRVTANNTCGSSEVRALKINRNAVASTPGAITGAIDGVCNKGNIPYSVTSVSGITYAWSWSVSSATIATGQGSNAITSNFLSGFVSGKLSVTATNACGTSTARTLTVYAKPPLAASISGPTSVCSGQQAVAYSITPLNNASSYIWYAPTGAHISDGTTTSTSTSLATTATNVTVNFSTTAGLVRVKGINACAAGSVASTTVAFTACKQTATLSDKIVSNTGDGSVYPNPSNGNFRITLGNVQKISATAKIEVTNEFGQVVYQTTAPCSNGIINLDLNTKLTNGIYFVNCTVNGEKTVRKLMISK
ncbi:MAG: T9SS type A sorting domain-containing protein, partial [Ferruginibacter sp.]